MKEQEASAPETTSLWDIVRSNLDGCAALLGLAVLGLVIFGVLWGVPREVQDAQETLASSLDSAQQAVSRDFDLTGYLRDLATGSEQVRAGGAGLGERPPGPGEDPTWPPRWRALLTGDGVNEIRFFPPEDLIGEAQFGSNLIQWAVNPLNNAGIAGFRLVRREADGPFVELATTDGAARSFVDSAVVAGRAYTYRVHATPSEPEVARQIPETEASQPLTLVAVADFRVVLVDADPDRQVAEFRVEKWHQDGWFEKRFIARVGESIGGADVGSGVDFSTGRIVRQVAAEKREEQRERFEVTFNPDGTVRLESGTPLTERVVTVEPVFLVKVALDGGAMPPEELTLEKR